MLSPHHLPAGIVATRQYAIPFRGLTYRVSHLTHFSDFATTQPLFCAAGAPPSRYVAPTGHAALYVALDAQTAFREFNQDFFYLARGVSGHALVRSGMLRPDPAVTLGIHIRISRVMNLVRSFSGRASPWTAYRTRTQLGISNRSDTELLQGWIGVANAPTQRLGTAVFNDGFFEGILYPSAQSRGQMCLVMFRDRLLATSRVDFHDAQTGINGHLP